MRIIPKNFADHIASGQTNLCTCWKIIRKDGTVYGFSDHDRPLHFDGVLFSPESGFTRMGAIANSAISADHGQVEGLLDDQRLLETDLADGLFDEAEYFVWRVNGQNVSERLLLMRGYLGEVRLGQDGFEVELRGSARLLERTVGRLFQRHCSAILGDSACQIDLSDPLYTANTMLAADAEADQLIVPALLHVATGFFRYGTISFLDGPLLGREFTIANHTRKGAVDHLSLSRQLRQLIIAGTQIKIVAGCDKSFATCQQKFSNQINFRGFPFMPGDDAMMQVPRRDENNDGGQR